MNAAETLARWIAQIIGTAALIIGAMFCMSVGTGLGIRLIEMMIGRCVHI